MRIRALGRIVREAPSWRLKCQCRYNSSVANDNAITIDDRTYPTDSWTNVPSSILAAVPRRLHLQPSHPISLTRRLIESRFPTPTYKYHNTFFPVVTVAQNFDSLGFPPDHPGRSRTDTYYVNKDTVLRTHTSAHQADTFRANESEGYLISADVYRRDAIDRSHYPIFHQMEGARMWDRRKVEGGDIAKAVWADLKKLPKHAVKVEDPNPTIHPARNPLQAEHHTAAEVEAIAAHLKRSIENVVIEIFTQAKAAAMVAAADSTTASTIPNSAAETEEPLRVRWIEAYFPFTSPSWELEVFWQGSWLELLGCGVVQQSLPINAGVPDQVGWAFGIGLERIAMLLFSIPDIRLFWSSDRRFLEQFSAEPDQAIRRFVPFSKYPSSTRDVAFWLPEPSSTSPSAPESPMTQPFHENDTMEIIRSVGGDLVESVTLVDSFAHPKTGRKSLCYRIVYRSLERTLMGEEVGPLHERVGRELVARGGVVLR